MRRVCMQTNTYLCFIYDTRYYKVHFTCLYSHVYLLTLYVHKSMNFSFIKVKKKQSNIYEKTSCDLKTVRYYFLSHSLYLCLYIHIRLQIQSLLLFYIIVHFYTYAKRYGCINIYMYIVHTFTNLGCIKYFIIF